MWRDATGKDDCDWTAVNVVTTVMGNELQAWYEGFYYGLVRAKPYGLLTVEAPVDIMDDTPFVPLDFLCVTAKMDREADTCISFHLYQNSLLEIMVCPRAYLPSRWNTAENGSKVWRPFRHAVKIQSRLEAA